jgi:hypothetical protein
VKPPARAIFVSGNLVMVGALLLSMYSSVNHFPQTVSSSALAAGVAGFSVIPFSGVLEWYLTPRFIQGRKLWLEALVSTSLIIAATLFWVGEALLSFSHPIDSAQTFGDGVVLSLVGVFSYLIASTMIGGTPR